ncbi:MAG: hypothetical protein ABSG61_07890 [Gemmatimonadales bacterium]|jgi:hypothetical protein
MDRRKVKRVRAELRQILQNQMDAGEPPETKQTFERLRAAGVPEDEVWRLMSGVLAGELATMMREERLYDRERYVRALGSLPNWPPSD